MQVSRVVLIGVVFGNVVLTEANNISLVATTLGLVALAGLKVYLGYQLFAPPTGPIGPIRPIILPPTVQYRFPPGSGDRFARDRSAPQFVDPPVVESDPEDKLRDAHGSVRIRRDVAGGIKLNKRFLRWLNAIDDGKCIHRFFCELGSDQNNFGNVGRLANMLVMMGGLQEGSWAQDMYDAGQDGRPCPKTCDERELSKTVDYLERHFFVPYVPAEDSEAAENE